MKKIIILALLSVAFALGLKAQTQYPTTLPNVNSVGWVSYDGVKMKYGYYVPTDTFCAKYATLILHTNGNWYYTLGNCTRWYQFGTGGSGGASSFWQLTGKPTLDTILALGNTSTRNISLEGDGRYMQVYGSGDFGFASLNHTTSAGGYLSFANASGGEVQVRAANVSGTKTLQAPNASGIIPLTVNGQSANSSGAITIPTGDGDSSTFSTNYRRDTAIRNVRDEIAAITFDVYVNSTLTGSGTLIDPLGVDITTFYQKGQVDSADALKADKYITSSTHTSDYTLVLTDAGKSVKMNVGSANAMTVPPNASVAFPVGTRIDVIQIGAGQTTITAGVGVTINSYLGNLLLTGQWAGATIEKTGTNSWIAYGNLTN